MVYSMLKTSLMHIAYARSGDKGDTVNIGLIARSPECYDWLCEHITSDKVKDWFKNLCFGKVERYVLPNLHALNFVLEQSLGGGGTKSLQIDPQGKTFAQALLRYEIEIPDELLETILIKNQACEGELIDKYTNRKCSDICQD